MLAPSASKIAKMKIISTITLSAVGNTIVIDNEDQCNSKRSTNKNKRSMCYFNNNKYTERKSNEKKINLN